MGEKIAFGFIGILLLGALGLCFWINLYLGFFILVFSIGVFWWIYGVKKKKVDNAFSKVAKDTGLSFHRNFLKYGTLKGNYRGHEAEIKVSSSTDAFGGMGTLLVSLTGEGALATLDIRNFTVMKIKHNLTIEDRQIISDNSPLIVADKNWIYLTLPYVSNDAKEIKQLLDKLCRVIE